MLLEFTETDFSSTTRRAHSIQADKDSQGDLVVVVTVISCAGVRYPLLYTASRFKSIQNQLTGEIYVQDGQWVQDPDKVYS